MIVERVASRLLSESVKGIGQFILIGEVQHRPEDSRAEATGYVLLVGPQYEVSYIKQSSFTQTSEDVASLPVDLRSPDKSIPPPTTTELLQRITQLAKNEAKTASERLHAKRVTDGLTEPQELPSLAFADIDVPDLAKLLANCFAHSASVEDVLSELEKAAIADETRELVKITREKIAQRKRIRGENA